MSSDTFITSFLIMTDVPPGHRLHSITDSRHVPHLRPGEWAVLDTSPVDSIDEVDWGEVYLLRHNGGSEVLWEVVRETAEQRDMRCDKSGLCVWLRPLDRCRTREEAPHQHRLIAGTLHMSDGPLIAEYLPPMIVGKVVGLYQTAPAIAMIEDARAGVGRIGRA